MRGIEPIAEWVGLREISQSKQQTRPQLPHAAPVDQGRFPDSQIEAEHTLQNRGMQVFFLLGRKSKIRMASQGTFVLQTTARRYSHAASETS
jgi:hypothetical protein